MRLRGLGAESLDLVGLVRLEVAFEPVPVARVLVSTLVGQNVRRNAVKKPPVVRNDHRAPRVLEQRVLEAAESLDVEVIGGLVE